ncbi:MAG: hypothetical protein C0594_05780 [Marinilabiliales bacterium]|nr:MAG: hypothetical protein C0594_05780 [Marinilabiliales bacterium]
MKKLLTYSVLVLIMFSCAKYEDGPEFSLLSRKRRIVNNWQLVMIENTVTEAKWDTSLSKVVWGFEETGAFWKSDNSTGIWEFLDELTLKISYDNEQEYMDSIEIFIISRLASKELWLKEQDVAEPLKYQFSPV